MFCVCIRIIVCSKKIIIVRNMNKCGVDMYLQCRSCLYALPYAQARQTRPNSGGVVEGHPRFDKGGVAIIFYFLRVKNRTF